MKEICQWCQWDETGACAYHKKRSPVKNIDPVVKAEWLKRIEPVVKSDVTLGHGFYLYILRLHDNKYYVGITGKSDPQRRISQHGDIWGARWTMLYPPLETIEVRWLGAITKHEAEMIENDETNRLMDKYGVNNVRGGKMVSSYPILTRTHNTFSRTWWRQKAVHTIIFLCAALLVIGLTAALLQTSAHEYITP